MLAVALSRMVMTWLALFVQLGAVQSMRIEASQKSQEEDELCIGCKTYPEAEDYPDDWRTASGIASTLEKMTEPVVTDEEKMKQVLLGWEITSHRIFNAMQGHMCMDMCAVCMPNLADMQSGEPKLSSVHISRAKNWQDTSIWPVVGVTDGALGAVGGALLAVPLSLGAFLGGGIVTGVAAGAATANVVHVSIAGTLLGLVAGTTVGAVSGTVLAALTEVVGVTAGLFKGVGITPLVSDCKRVGFESFYNGNASTMEQRFTSKFMNSDYGLKRLRKWMENNADWQQNMAREEILPGDEGAIHHCERVREHSFDIRHAGECVKHSQLCGPNGGVFIPVPSAKMCQQVSDTTWLERTAVTLGDDPETGFFAAWREMQEKMRNATGHDGKKVQCIRTLCEYGGFKRASMKLHPDRVGSMDLPDEEKAERTNLFTFLSSCKSQYHGLTLLDSKEEREFACAAFSQ